MSRRSQPLKNRVAMMVGRGDVRLVDDGEGGQTLQMEGLADEILEDIQRPQPYGLSTRPLAGAKAVTVAPGGTRHRSIAVVVEDRRYRIDLEEGEVAIHDDLGQKVHLTRAGIVIETSQDVTVTAGGAVNVSAEGDVLVEAQGNATVNAEGDVTIDAGGAASVTAAGDIEMSSETKVIVDAPELRLGGPGGQKVARVGDSVAGGNITSGATKVYAT